MFFRGHLISIVQKKDMIVSIIVTLSWSCLQFYLSLCNTLRSRHFLSFCRYWLSVGAQPSDPVQRLLFRAGMLPPPPMLAMGRKGGPRDTRPVDPMTGQYLTSEKPTTSDQSKDGETEDLVTS